MDQEADTQSLTSYSSFSDTPRLKSIYSSNIVKPQNSKQKCIKKSQITFYPKIREPKILNHVPVKTLDANVIPNVCRVADNRVPMYNNVIGNNVDTNIKKKTVSVRHLLFQQNGVPVKAFPHSIVKENFNRQSEQGIKYHPCYQFATATSASKRKILPQVTNEKKVTASQIIQKAISQQLKQSNTALDRESKCLNKSILSRQVTSSQNQFNVVSNSNLSTRPSSSKIDNTMILSNKQNASQLNLHKQGSSPNIKRRKIVGLLKGQ
jgi:hypothetical protein